LLLPCSQAAVKAAAAAELKAVRAQLADKDDTIKVGLVKGVREACVGCKAEIACGLARQHKGVRGSVRATRLAVYVAWSVSRTDISKEAT
jgi:hypothetical protein